MCGFLLLRLWKERSTLAWVSPRELFGARLVYSDPSRSQLLLGEKCCMDAYCSSRCSGDSAVLQLEGFCLEAAAKLSVLSQVAQFLSDCPVAAEGSLDSAFVFLVCSRVEAGAHTGRWGTDHLAVPDRYSKWLHYGGFKPSQDRKLKGILGTQAWLSPASDWSESVVTSQWALEVSVITLDGDLRPLPVISCADFWLNASFAL
eukprot:5808272-Amphidinium_carterae.2